MTAELKVHSQRNWVVKSIEVWVYNKKMQNQKNGLLKINCKRNKKHQTERPRLMG